MIGEKTSRGILAIDPGRKGAMAYRYGSDEWLTKPLPYLGSNVDGIFIASSISLWEPKVIIIESQTIYRGQGGKSSATTMRNYGILLGLVESYKFYEDPRVTLLTPDPKEWQEVIIPHAKRGETKPESIAYALKHHPDLSLKRTPRCREDSDGISDAICMVDWYSQTHEED